MMRWAARKASLTLVAMAACCLLPTPRAAAADEDAVRDAFTALQAAIKARDGDMTWDLLDKASQVTANQAAKALRANYDKASADDKAKQEKALGLSADEFSKLSGKLFLKSKRFHGKYHEVPGSKIDKVSVDKDKATVNYIEDDGDKEKLVFVRQDGKWKASLRMP